MMCRNSYLILHRFISLNVNFPTSTMKHVKNLIVHTCDYKSFGKLHSYYNYENDLI